MGRHGEETVALVKVIGACQMISEYLDANCMDRSKPDSSNPGKVGQGNCISFPKRQPKTMSDLAPPKSPEKENNYFFFVKMSNTLIPSFLPGGKSKHRKIMDRKLCSLT